MSSTRKLKRKFNRKIRQQYIMVRTIQRKAYMDFLKGFKNSRLNQMKKENK